MRKLIDYIHSTVDVDAMQMFQHMERSDDYIEGYKNAMRCVLKFISRHPEHYKLSQENGFELGEFYIE